MRLRNVKGSEETLGNSQYVLQSPKEWKGHFSELFANSHPIHLEIGMGKGKFITSLAEQHSEINYIGMEKFSSVLVRGVEKQAQMELSNLYFMRADAEWLPDIFEKDEISRIYLNFSDPWPKDRHAKRRLTSKEFFLRYDQVLRSEGRIEFKTDNFDLFQFSLEQTEEAGWEIVEKTFDLHHSEFMEGNVMTEYEERFSKKGNPIYKMVVIRRDRRINA